jgi:hypothetical protein
MPALAIMSFEEGDTLGRSKLEKPPFDDEQKIYERFVLIN